MAGLVAQNLSPFDPSNIEEAYRIREQLNTPQTLWNNTQRIYGIDKNKDWYSPSNLIRYGNMVIDASPWTLGGALLTKAGLKALTPILGGALTNYEIKEALKNSADTYENIADRGNYNIRSPFPLEGNLPWDNKETFIKAVKK